MPSPRAVVTLYRAPDVDEGSVRVHRVLPTEPCPAVGPFIFFDHIGPREVAAGAMSATPPHPHAGLETLSYVIEGCAEHHDSQGHRVSVRAGEAQWMRAGRGIVHTEGPGQSVREQGGRVHAVQLWINLPRGHKHDEPAYRAIEREDIPKLQIDDATVSLLAGAIEGHVGPVATYADPFAAHVVFAASGTAVLMPPPEIELGIYCLTGRATVNDARLSQADLALSEPGEFLTIAVSDPASLLLFGGPPLDAPIVRHGPFVMNTEIEMRAAIADYHAGRMGAL